MEQQQIELKNLKLSPLNVRKKGGKEVSDILPSIRAMGILQPLLVRPNCEGFEIVAGQRRYNAKLILAEEGDTEPVPCIVMKDGDDAKAIEASLMENITRLPMDEIDQYKAFAALEKKGRSVDEIATQFGISERLVKQRLALGNLIAPILTAYSKEQISVGTIRSLTLATKRQQKEWLALFNSDEHAPQGHALKEWLFGGRDISVEVALFDEADYQGGIVTDLFSENRYFDDSAKFWELQNKAIAKAKERYELDGWQEVIILDVNDFFYTHDHAKAPKTKGGRVYVQISYSGEVTLHEGFITRKEAEKREKAKAGETEDKPIQNPEITKVMQNYLALHRHAAVRAELIGHQGVALRLALAQMIAGSDLWSVQADPQKANNDAIQESLGNNKAEGFFAAERSRIRALFGGIGKESDDTIVYRKDDWSKSHDIHVVFAKLLKLDDASVNMILTFVVAETLPCGSALVEVLADKLEVNMADHWQPDQVFFDLLRDKEVVNSCLKEAAGKDAAEAHISSTAKVQKKIIADVQDGTRANGKKDWQPRYMAVPMTSYTKRGGIEAVDQWKRVKKHFA